MWRLDTTSYCTVVAAKRLCTCLELYRDPLHTTQWCMVYDTSNYIKQYPCTRSFAFTPECAVTVFLSQCVHHTLSRLHLSGCYIWGDVYVDTKA